MAIPQYGDVLQRLRRSDMFCSRNMLRIRESSVAALSPTISQDAPSTEDSVSATGRRRSRRETSKQLLSTVAKMADEIATSSAIIRALTERYAEDVTQRHVSLRIERLKELRASNLISQEAFQEKLVALCSE